MFLSGAFSVLFTLPRCPGEESNLHAHYGHMNLNHARLPIPPPGLVVGDFPKEFPATEPIRLRSGKCYRGLTGLTTARFGIQESGMQTMDSDS